MESKHAIAALSALGQESRLTIFRLLVKAGPAGLAAGAIARELGTLPNTLSANLAVLSHAGLAIPRREGRSIIYCADYAAMSALLGFLMADCCDGSPEICMPLEAIVARAADCAGACQPKVDA